jgi:selenocysteine lyase/cysteine desulfurase
MLPGAARFEAGSPNVLGIVGLQAALELLMEADLVAIERSLGQLRTSVTDIVCGHHLVEPDWHPATPLISFPMAREKAQDLYAHLNAKNISLSLRESPERVTYVRISPHFYNDRHDLDQLDKAIGDWSR